MEELDDDAPETSGSRRSPSRATTTSTTSRRSTSPRRHTELDVPADVRRASPTRCAGSPRAAFEALSLRGLARVDFFLLSDGEVVLNEINTMPGFTPSSMFPRMWAATGLDYPALVDRLLQLALRRRTGLR